MPILRAQLQGFRGRVCLMGLGNPEYGDDGLGVRLAERLQEAGLPDVVIAGASPERHIGPVIDAGFDHVVFLDAVELDAVPGSAVLLDARDLAERFRQVSTHKLSLGALAQYVEADGATRAWLLGVQPATLRPADRLSPAVEATLDILVDLFREASLARHLSEARNP
jgi:hydrogenase maturation protease